MTRRLTMLLMVSLPLGCALPSYPVHLPMSAYVGEDVSSWPEYRTVTDDRVVHYKLPSGGDFTNARPRDVALLKPKSEPEQYFARIAFPPNPGIPCDALIGLELRPFPSGSIDPDGPPEEFASFLWTQVYGRNFPTNPWWPPFEPVREGELIRIGDAVWYHLISRNRHDPDHERLVGRVIADIYARPLSRSYSLTVIALYLDYFDRTPVQVEEWRGLVRKIVSEVRIDPPATR
jgi:hypothetical protein